MTEAADAATICLIRAAHHGPEVLMVQRPESAKFMAGAWVFPGGAVDDSDADRGMSAHEAAGLRELVEETGIWLLTEGEQVTERRPEGTAVFDEAPGPFGADRLRCFANWVTPEPLPIRFDTRFFVTEVSRRVEALVDGKELVDAAWIDPADAIERADAGDWLIAFPTRQALQVLSGHDSVAALYESLPDPEAVEPVQPRIAVSDDSVRIVLPTEPGFDDIDESDPELLDRAQAVAAAGGDVPAEMR